MFLVHQSMMSSYSGQRRDSQAHSKMPESSQVHELASYGEPED